MRFAGIVKKDFSISRVAILVIVKGRCDEL